MYINPFSVHLQCFSVCIIGDVSVRESVLPFWGGKKKRRRRRLAFLLGGGGQVCRDRQESDRLQSLTALHYLSWGGAVSVCGGEDLVSGQMSHSEFVHTSVGDRHAERCAVDVSQLLENFRRAAKS